MCVKSGDVQEVKAAIERDPLLCSYRIWSNAPRDGWSLLHTCIWRQAPRWLWEPVLDRIDSSSFSSSSMYVCMDLLMYK